MNIIDDNKPGNPSERTDTSAAGNTEPASRAGESEEMEYRTGEYKKYARRQAYPNWIDILAIVGIIIGSSLVAGLVLMLLGAVSNMPSGLLQAVGYTLQFVLAITFVMVLQKQRGITESFLRLNFGTMNLPLILWGVLLIFVTGVVIEPLLNLFPDRYLDMLDSAIGTGGWAILTTVLLAPVLEEVLFRGLILGPVKRKSGALAAVLISAAIFGVIHIIPQQVVNAFVAGIILGYIYVKTESLAAVILIHAINNAVSFLLRELMGSTSASLTTRAMIGSDPAYYIIYGVCLVLFVVGIVGMIRTLRNSKPSEHAEACVESEAQPAPAETSPAEESDDNNNE